MKKVIFTFFVLSISCTLILAQDFAKKGVAEAGGSISFTSTTAVSNGETADESTSKFTFAPFLGYFIIDGLELGLQPRFSSTSFGDNSTSELGIFFVPLYHFDLKSSAYPYIGGAVGYNSYTDMNDNTYSGISFAGLAGVKVQVGNSALVDFGVNYMVVTLNPEDYDGDRNGYNELGVSVGVAIYFGKR